MKLSQSQVQKLSQELRLTPQQILQSMILQLNTLSLEARVNQELERNPVLEETEEQDEQPNEEVSESKEEDEIDWDELLPQNDDYEPKQEYDSNRKVVQYVQPSPQGMVDRLLDQLKLLNLTPLEINIAHEIVWNLDERGYLTIPLENIAAIQHAELALVDRVLKEIQTFDPPGIAARNLQECLLIQLRQIEGATDAILIIRDYFEDFANRRLHKIIKELNWTSERLQAVQNIILRLNPKPGTSLLSVEQDYIVPDLTVYREGDDFVIEVNDTRIPDLQISPQYLQMLKRGANVSPETKSYLKKKVETARWFIQSIYQRRLTMIRVMKAIIERQREFFEGNHQALRPMILKDIAEDIEMDISTISRVTNGKYVQLSDGIYELKYFFNEGMLDGSGEEVSTRIIKDKLREIIEKEDKHKPYSDDQLAKLLKDAGFPIARRTVAKYREQLKVPVARLRRCI
jgi:RNA polymerase sigma-54 factor